MSRVEHLVREIIWKNSRDRRAAARELVEIGPAAVESLINVLQEEDVSARATAAWALGEIGDNRAIVPLKKALIDNDPHVQRRSVEALKKLGIFPGQLLITALKNSSVVTWSRSVNFLKYFQDIFDTILYITHDIKFRIVDSVNLIIGRGTYSNVSLLYFHINNHYGKNIRLDAQAIHKTLPSHSPCEKCGTMLQKPFYPCFSGTCPECHHYQNYAQQQLDSTKAKLLRREFRKNKHLRKEIEYQNHGKL